jgi:hypothetical protein
VKIQYRASPGIAQALRGDEKITARRGQAELDDGRELLGRTPDADAAESVLCAGLAGTTCGCAAC